MIRQHAITQAYNRASAFGLEPASAIRLAERMTEAVSHEFGLTDFILVIAASDQKVWVDQSNGHYLCAIVRDKEIHTFLLRRKSQIRKNGNSRLGDLRYFIRSIK